MIGWKQVTCHDPWHLIGQYGGLFFQARVLYIPLSVLSVPITCDLSSLKGVTTLLLRFLCRPIRSRGSPGPFVKIGWDNVTLTWQPTAQFGGNDLSPHQEKVRLHFVFSVWLLLLFWVTRLFIVGHIMIPHQQLQSVEIAALFPWSAISRSLKWALVQSILRNWIVRRHKENLATEQ